MSKLEPIIIKLLQKNDLSEEALVEAVNKITGVNKEKILFRVSKLVERDQLAQSGSNLSMVLGKEEELFENSAFTLRRKGKIVSLQSHWKPEERAEFLVNLRDHYPKAENELKDSITYVSEYIRDTLNPLDACSYLAFENLFVDPETYAEWSFKGKQLIVELVQNMILQRDYSEYNLNVDPSQMHELKDKFKIVLQKLDDFLLCLMATKKNLTDVEQEIYMKTINRFVYVRGDAYPQHYEEIATELFTLFNETLRKKGFTIEEYFFTAKEIERQIKQKVPESVHAMTAEFDRFRKEISEFIASGMSEADAFKKYLDDSVDRREKVGKQVRTIGNADAYKITINDHINTALLDKISLSFGSTKNWSSPFDMSLTNVKPLIQLNGDYYCFNQPHLTRNSILIIEHMLNKEEKQEFGSVRGKYFEEKTIVLLKKLLPKSIAYKKLFYPTKSGSSSNRAELDGLVIDDNRLLLIEIKGKKRQTLAGRWQDLDATIHNIKEQLETPFEQAKRALEFIETNDVVEFRDENKKPIVKIRNANYAKKFLINVTVDAFHEFTGDAGLLKRWEPSIFQNGRYAWSVSIYDLMVISDLLENSAQFYDYLNERLRLAEYESFEVADELDYLGYFFEHGSLASPEESKNANKTMIHGYTDDIDRYYSFLRGEVKEATKPHKK